MKILITAGGTAEKIDQVRKIANGATGRLGCLTAYAFARRVSGPLEIFYVHGPGAAVPVLDCVRDLPVESAEDLRAAVSGLLAARKIDAVVHSMAVSDYTVAGVTTAERLAGEIAEELRGAASLDRAALAASVREILLSGRGGLEDRRKIRSDHPDLLLCLRPTPKVIGLFKQSQPETLLVGFKLLDHVPRQELLRAAREVMERNRCDYVLANDAAEITEDRHVGCLLAPDGTSEPFETKEAIAEGIAGAVLRRWEERGGRI